MLTIFNHHGELKPWLELHGRCVLTFVCRNLGLWIAWNILYTFTYDATTATTK